MKKRLKVDKHGRTNLELKCYLQGEYKSPIYIVNKTSIDTKDTIFNDIMVFESDFLDIIKDVFNQCRKLIKNPPKWVYDTEHGWYINNELFRDFDIFKESLYFESYTYYIIESGRFFVSYICPGDCSPGFMVTVRMSDSIKTKVEIYNEMRPVNWKSIVEESFTSFCDRMMIANERLPIK